MLCKCESTLSESNPFSIHDTTEISAKRLMVLFMEMHDSLETLLCESQIAKTFFALLNKKEYKKAYSLLEDMPWTVCECFCRFILECPHIHVTID